MKPGSKRRLAVLLLFAISRLPALFSAMVFLLTRHSRPRWCPHMDGGAVSGWLDRQAVR
jgi:hypothetical protein